LKGFFPAVYNPFNLQCDNYHTANYRDTKHANILSHQQNKGSATLIMAQALESLEKDVVVSFSRKRQSDIATQDLVCWSNRQELKKELQLEHSSEQRRLFMDLSKVSLKALLLHNGNKFPSFPLAYAVRMIETYKIL